ncbi:MAG: hypothetical protein QME58_12490 [Bacteroidota bacterium]|nr:hypothetical protein [Bacteroidota bacterium]
MSNITQVQTMVGSDGALIELPKNFERLPERKQKQLILSVIQENIIQMNDFYTNEKRVKEVARVNYQRIRSSKEYRQAAEAKKEAKNCHQMCDLLSTEINGMLKIANKLGFDIREELKKIKQIGE